MQKAIIANLLVVGVIIFSGFVIYSNSFSNQFVWDDFSFVVKNDAIKNINNIPSFFTNASTLTKSEIAHDTYRPLVTLSFSLDYFFWRLNPRYYHIENVLFHIVNAILLFFLAKLIVKNFFASILISLLFLAHPLQTEVVDWISRRGDVLGTFFYLIAFLIHLRTRNIPVKKSYIYPTILLFFSIAILFKETAITLPLILMFYDIFLLRDRYSYKNYLNYYAPFFIIIVLYGLARLAVVGQIVQRGWWGNGPIPTFFTMCTVFVDYTRFLILPKNLCADRVVQVIYSPFDIKLISSIAVLFFIFALAILLRNRVKLFTFGIYWFFISLIPVANIFPIKILAAERFLYIPSIGFFIALTGLILIQKRSFIKISYLLLFFLIVFYGVLTIERNKDWRDELTFSKINSIRSPYSRRMHYNLGIAYKEHGMLDDAIAEFRKAIKLNPEYFEAYNNLGNTYLARGHFDDAIKCYKKAISVSPQIFQPYYNLANAYFEKGDYEIAIKNYKKALSLEKDRPDIHYNLSLAYIRNGQMKEAVNELEIVLKLNPQDLEASELLKKIL